MAPESGAAESGAAAPGAAGPAADIAAKRQAFAELHRTGCFVLPNPWDVGSARYLAALGFPAIATTSAGFAWTRGRPDNGVTLEVALAHLREMSAAVGVPVNADFEGGFAAAPDGVAENVRRAAGTGIAGLSIEDSTGEPSAPLHDFGLAVERIRAAHAALAGTGVLLVARSEGYLVGRADLGETVRRLVAYAEAGADCLYAPGVRTPAEIGAIVRAVAPKPVNVLVWTDFTTVADLAALGVRRISVGGALARTAWGGFMAAASEIANEGTFRRLGMAAQSAELNGLFASD